LNEIDDATKRRLELIAKSMVDIEEYERGREDDDH
jgi:hypothetical protein